VNNKALWGFVFLGRCFMKEMNTVPILTATRVRLRPMRMTDGDVYYRIHSDPQSTAFYDWVPESREAALESIRDIIEDYREGHYIHFALESLPEGVLIGDLGIFLRDAKGEVNFFIDREHAGKGLMSEALMALMAWAFDTRQLVRIQALTMPENQSANRMLARLGFTLEGTLRQYGYDAVRGVYRDLEMWSLLLQEWQTKE